MNSKSTRNSFQSRRRFLLAASTWFSLGMMSGLAGCRADGTKDPSRSFDETIEEVVPTAGIRVPLSFGYSIRRLVLAGVIDPAKLRALSRGRPGTWLSDLFAARSPRTILFSAETAPYLLDLLWPLGLANKAAFNTDSPINTLRLPSYASTGGWSLGGESDGYVYFNSVEALPLSKRQETTALQVAKTTFRPCCDNSTYFQDCNHGSALLGLIELAAFHGLSAEEIYRIALVANSYWFPEQYIQAAVYFSTFENQSWQDIRPDLVLGRRFSSASGWESNINSRLRSEGLLPDFRGFAQGPCGI